MSAPTPPAGPSPSPRSLYEPGLDGLRLVAFLAVFLHHLPGPPRSILAPFHSHGWSGVELFFAISAYLLFHLLNAEYEKTGRIRIGNFYTRRLLRIYPLMMAFALAMFVLFSNRGGEAIFRLLGLATLTDNLITVFARYNSPSPSPDICGRSASRRRSISACPSCSSPGNGGARRASSPGSACSGGSPSWRASW